jgi:hypothetical protein
MRYVFAAVLILALDGCSEPPPPGKGPGTTPTHSTKPPSAPAKESKSAARPSTSDSGEDVLTLGTIPDITLSSSSKPAIDSEGLERVISSLAEIDRPDIGFSPTMAGRAFAPLEGQSSMDVFVWMDHKLTSSGALKQLVALGPAALPALLSHLDDKTPTKLKVEEFGFGEFYLTRELGGNPLNTSERSVLDTLKSKETDWFESGNVESFTVKVGDVCLVAIGQITGRGYNAVRYKPSGLGMINSPTHDPELCAHVRSIWQSGDPRRHLLDALLLDYSTRGRFNGESPDGWYVGSSLQIEAAMRLLFYYPEESAVLIASRVDKLNVQRPSPSFPNPTDTDKFSAYMRREVLNGVDTEGFIAAISWSQSPEIVAAISRVADRTNDEKIIGAIAKGRQNRPKPVR